MRALRVNQWGPAEALRVEVLPDPEPGEGEVRIAVHSASVGFGDALVATGQYQVRPALPFTPGVECSGRIDAIGSGVDGFGIGDAVTGVGFIGVSRTDRRILGSMAERVIVPPANLMRVPDGMSLELACFFRSTNETAYFGLERGGLGPGETLLVLGAGGGTGFAAVALGKLMGARVIASASSPAKRALAVAAGADATVARDDPDWRHRVSQLSDGRGPDVIFDPVGGSATEQAFRSLAEGGRLVTIGYAAGAIPKLPVNLALLKNASLIGANLDIARHSEPDDFRRRAVQLAQWFEQGRLPLAPIARRYPLERAGEAFAAILGGQVDGRVIVQIGSSDASRHPARQPYSDSFR